MKRHQHEDIKGFILYIKDDLYYKLNFNFQGSENPNDNINIIFINNAHYDLLLKRNFKYDLSIISENQVFENQNNNNNNIKKVRKKIINKIIKDRQNDIPDKDYIKKNFLLNDNNVTKGIYVDYSKNIKINVMIFLNI